MDTMADFFEWINSLLGVRGPGELVSSPIFIGAMIVAFIYSFIKGWKFFTTAIFALMGGGVIYHYLFPQDTSDLSGLIKFLGAMGVLALVAIYLAFIRE